MKSHDWLETRAFHEDTFGAALVCRDCAASGWNRKEDDEKPCEPDAPRSAMRQAALNATLRFQSIQTHTESPDWSDLTGHLEVKP